MFKFKFHNTTYAINDPILIDIFKALRTVDEFCMYFNLLTYHNRLKDLIDGNTVVSFKSRLLNLKLIKRLDNGYIISNLSNKILGINQFQSKGKIQHHRQLVKDILSMYQKTKGNEKSVKLAVKKIQKKLDIFTIVKQNPSGYFPKYHEDYVYSDANWSCKDASL